MKISMNNLLIILIIIATLMLSNCGNQEVSTRITPYVGGNEGLTLEFQAQRPPDKIYGATTEGGEDVPGSSFSVGILLKNKGEEGLFDEVDDDEDNVYNDFGRLTLRGINPVHYNVDENDLIINFDDPYYDVVLRPNKKYVEEGPSSQGGTATVQFPTMNYMHEVEGFNEASMMVDLCYNYKTKSTTNICIVEDSANNKICNPVGDKVTSNSGAPVHVKKINQAPIGNKKIQVLIEIGKVDLNGEVFAPIDTNNIPERVCDDATTNTEKNKVYVKVTLPDGGDAISCSDFRGENEGMILMNEVETTTVFCDIDSEDIAQDYETQLRVDLEYSYGQYVQKKIILSQR